MTIEEKLDDFELRLPLKLRAEFRQIRAMLKKAIKQRDDFMVRMSGDFDLAKLKEQRDADQLPPGEGT